MTQKMLTPTMEISVMYPLSVNQEDTPILNISPNYREIGIIKIWDKDNKKAFINKKPIYKAKEYELF